MRKFFTFLFALVASVGMSWAGEVTIVFAANNNTKEVTVELPHTFWCSFDDEDGELDLIIQELYGLSMGGFCDDDVAPTATGNAAVTAGKAGTTGEDHYITISDVFAGTATVEGSYYGYYQSLEEESPEAREKEYSLTISIKNYAPEPLADCELSWKDVPEGGVVGTIGHEDEVVLPYFTASLDFMLALDAGTVTLRLGSTDESVLAVNGINDFAVNGVGECDVYIVHDEDAVFAYDSAAFHVTVNPEPTPVVNLKLIEFQVPASWENDNTPISSADFPDFVATTYEIASALPVTSEPSLVVFDFPGDDEVSVYTKVGGQVSKTSTGTIVREAFFGQTQLHYYYPVLAGDDPLPTAVENVQTNHVQATKFFRNGQLLILRGDKVYTVTGAEVR